MNTFVFDPLTGEPTIIATNRAKRVDQTGAVSSIQNAKATDSESEKPKKRTDYFAKGNEHLTPPTLYQDEDDWNVRVFKNKFPLLEDHEIVVHSPFEDKDIEDLPIEQTVRIIRAYLNRVAYYNAKDKEVFIFNNRGGKAGASIEHPHSQILAAKGFPGTMEREKSAALHYFNEFGRSYWSDEMQKELGYGKRVIHESAHFVLYVPYVSRWSYEMRLVPKEHRPNILYITEPEIQDFARILKGALVAYNQLFDRPDRNFWIHNLRYEPYHWHVGFLPHIKVFGALEMGAGIWVSDKATSEDAAADLRQHFKCED